jgi:predicted N-acetyltransferase YhbS/ketosteroid isomerase-like protein
MTDVQQLAQDFLKALSSNDPASYATLLSDDAALRLGRWDGSELYRPRKRVIPRLMNEWSAWPDPTLETLTIIAAGDKAAIEFRIQATEHERFVEHTRSAFLTIKDDKISIIDLYCNEPVPSARRKGWIAPATLTETELHYVFESLMNSGDPREWVAPDENEQYSLRGGMGGSGQAHPSSNGVGGVRWTAAEADQKIEEIIAYHRARNIGFQWWVSPYDTPADLRERLERHGLVLAGDAATMARLGLDQLDDIPCNAHVTIEQLDGYDDEAIDAVGRITIACFNWPPEQVAERRPSMVERLRNLKIREREMNYLARLNGEPVGYGRLQLRAGVAYLGGAATLPEFRGQHVYSTLVRLRLQEARARGYHLAIINAEPLSRPIVARCGFKEYGRTYIYGWMPVIDEAVIKSLVPQ